MHSLTFWTGLLSLEEFRLLSNDAFQRFLMQRGVKRSQLVRNSRHTWLYQGKGAHQVLQDIKTRLVRQTMFSYCCEGEVTVINHCNQRTVATQEEIHREQICSQTCIIILYLCLIKGDSPYSAPTYISGPQRATPGGPLRRGGALPRPPWQWPRVSWNSLHTHAPCRQRLHSFWNVLQVRAASWTALAGKNEAATKQNLWMFLSASICLVWLLSCALTLWHPLWQLAC